MTILTAERNPQILLILEGKLPISKSNNVRGGVGGGKCGWDRLQRGKKSFMESRACVGEKEAV